MKIIRNTQLFRELAAMPGQHREHEDFDQEALRIVMDHYTVSKPDGDEPAEDAPMFAGGLDHVEWKPKGVYFMDRGISGSGYSRNTSFVIRPEL